MLRPLLAIVMVIALVSGADAARKKKKKKGKKPAEPRIEKTVKNEREEKPGVAEAETAKAEPAAVPGGNSGEMDAYRAIQNRPESTVQDLADLLLMYRGEYAKHSSAEARLKRAKELNLLGKDNTAQNKLTRGALAYALMRVYKPEQGILFWLTGWERYALRDAQEAGIIPGNSTENQHISGEQLFAIMTDAENFVTQRSEWDKK